MHTAIIKTLEERQRQIHEEGFTAARDDQYTAGELNVAADCYSTAAFGQVKRLPNAMRLPLLGWPETWDKSWWKPSPDPKRNIIKAMALLAAEYDRIERAEAATKTPVVETRYSADDEWQSGIYDELSDLIEDRELEEGQTVYIGVKRLAQPNDFTANLEEGVIENMGIQAEEEYGEVAEDYPVLSEPQTQTLQILIEAWATQYCTPDFYTIVNVKPYTITPDDLQALNQ